MRHLHGMETIQPAPPPTGAETAWDALVRRRELATFVLCACLAATAALATALPDLYRAAATLLVDRDGAADVLARSTPPEAAETRLESITQRVLVRERLGGLCSRFDLYPDGGGAAECVERARRDVAVAWSPLEAGGARGSSVAFTVSFRHPDPRKAAAVANALAMLYVDESTLSRERRATTTSDLFEAELRGLSARVRDAEGALAEYKNRYLGELPEQVPSNLATLGRLNGDLQRVEERRLRLLERRDAPPSAEPARAVSDGATDAARVDELRRSLSALRSRYREDHPDIVALKDQIAALERDTRADPAGVAADGRTASADGALSIELSTLDAERERLEREIGSYQARVDAAPRREQELQRLSREVDSARDAYDATLKRDEDAKLAGRVVRSPAAEPIRILERAVVPTRPEAPRRASLAVFGLLLSLAAAAGAIALAEKLDTTFHSREELAASTRFSVLPSIPHLETRASRRRGAIRRAAWAAGGTLLVAIAAGAAWWIARGNDALVALIAGHAR